MKTWILLLGTTLPLSAATVDYEKQLFPLLKDNCLPCHNKTTTKGGLNMETVDLMLKGGDSGSSLERGTGAKSILYQAAAGEWDSEMPPKNNKVSALPLTSVQLALLKQWIDEGAHHSGKQERVITWEPLPAGFGPIYAAAVTSDGQYAAAARGNQVSVYFLPTATLVTRLTDETLIKSGLYAKPGVAHRDVAPALAFSPDGQRLATGSYREIKIWKRTAPVSAPVARHTAPATPAKFKLAPAGADGISLVDTKTGTTLRTLNHGAAVSAFTLSPDEQRIATAGSDHKIKFWEAATGKLMREIVGDSATAQQMAKAGLASERAALEISWWTERVQKTGKEVTDLDARLKKGLELQATAKKAIDDKRRDAQSKAAAKTQADGALKALDDQVAQLPEGKPDDALAKKQTEARDAATKAAEAAKVAREALTRAEDAVSDAAREIELVSSLKTKAAEASAAAKATLEQNTKILEQTTAAKAQALKAHSEAIQGLQALGFSPDGAQLAGVDATGRMRTWAVASGRAVSSHIPKLTVSWTDQTGPVLRSNSAGAPADSTHSQWKWERTLGSGDAKSPISDRANALAFSPDGKTLAVGSGEPSRTGDITLWQIADGALKSRWDEVHLDSVLALDYSPDGKYLASGGADKALRIIDTSTGKPVKVFEGHTHHVLGVSWRADGRLLASAGADNVVKIWDWTTGERRQNITGWDKEVTAVRYLGGTDTLITTSGDAKMRVLSSAGAELRQLPGAVDFMNSLGVTPSGDWLVAGGHDGILRWWNAQNSKDTGSFAGDLP
jgi:WD40 repeat protein